MKNLLIISILVTNLVSFSQSYPVAVDDSVDIRLGDYITVNVLENDYHPDGLNFRIRAASINSYTDSTITFYIDYDEYYNESGEFQYQYWLEDENGLFGSESWGYVHLKLANDYSDSLDLNNIKALINPYGSQFWRGPGNENSNYEFPNGSGKTTIFTSSFWIGGMDQNGQLRLSAERYRQVGCDYWAGPLSVNESNLSIDTATVSEWHRVWKLNKEDIEYHKYNWYKPNYEPIENIANWPAHGDTSLNQSRYIAPFVDIDGDGDYNPFVGDYPLIKGDQCVFFVFNDLKEEHRETQGNTIGLEIHGMMYQFDEQETPAFNNTVFMNYKIFNRTSYILTDTYIGIWSDIDLGYARDDYVGCDVERGMYIGYNGDEIDGNGEPEAYGENPPAQGVLFLGGPHMDSNEVDDPDGGCDESINGVGFGDGIIDNERYGMTGFLYHNNSNGSPSIAQHYYDYMRGIWKDGIHMDYGNTGHPVGGSYGPDCNFLFPGLTDSCMWGTDGIQPNGLVNWREETGWYGEPTPPEDRRGIGSTGPFTFMPGSVQKIDIAYVTARGDNGPLSSVELLKVYADTIRARFVKNSDDFGTQFLGVGETNEKSLQLKIFPNPVEDILNVEYEGKGQNSVYQIHDIYGRLLLSGDIFLSGNFSINVSNLKSGIYIVSVIDDKYRYTTRLVKSKTK